MQQLAIEIGGMSCGHCVKAVNTALTAMDGVTVEQVAVGRAAVAYDPSRVEAGQIAHAIEDAGYQVTATH